MSFNRRFELPNYNTEEEVLPCDTCTMTEECSKGGVCLQLAELLK